MKVILRSSSLPLTLLGILAHAGVARVDTSLRRGMAGRVHIGMTLDQLEAEPGLRFSVSPEACDLPVVLASTHDAEPALLAEFPAGSLTRCRVLSRRYRTSSGIGVGSPLSELVRLYAIEWPTPDSALVEELNMTFEIRDEKIASILLS